MASNNGGRQFDPVASAATSALDTTQRTIRNFQSQMGAPELPAQSKSFSGLRSMVRSVADFSPINVAARGDLPMSPGSEGQSPLPSLENLFPGNLAGTNGAGIPTPDQLLGSNGGSKSRRKRRRKSNGGNGGNGGSNGNGNNGAPSREERR